MSKAPAPASTVLCIVVPCYNESDALPASSKVLLDKLENLAASGRISNSSRVLFVDDGSTDDTWQIIKSLNINCQSAVGVKLSRNCGHQNALLAGLEAAHAFADCAVSIDADLQDDADAIDKMLERYHSGTQIVCGVRDNRDADTFFKRSTAWLFYKFMKFLGADIIENHADFRLLSRDALGALLRFTEANMFLRGVVPLLGYKSEIVYYGRGGRVAGESKYPLRKMVKFAFDGITSFSVKPIRLPMLLGTLAFSAGILTAICAVYMVISGIGSDTMVILASIWLIGGAQLLSIGVIGEYIGKIYAETKKRPRYIVEEIIE